MGAKAKYRKPLPKRFNAAVSEEAYARLRALASRSGLSNNYVLTILLESFDGLTTGPAFDAAVAEMLERSRRE